MSRAKSRGMSAVAFGSGAFSRHEGMTMRQSIPTIRDESIGTASTLAMTHDLGADLRENPPTRHDIAAEVFAATDAAVALTNKGKTLLALDTAAELGRMQRSSLWQSDGACDATYKLWASSRNIAVQFVAKNDAPGSLDVMRLVSDAVDVTYYFDGPVRK